jgi:hypothetical protein
MVCERIFDDAVATFSEGDFRYSVLGRLAYSQLGAAGRADVPACQIVTQRRFEFQLGVFTGSTAMFLPVFSQFCHGVFMHNQQSTAFLRPARRPTLPKHSTRSDALTLELGKSHAVYALCKSLQTQEGHSEGDCADEEVAGFALCGSLGARDKRSYPNGAKGRDAAFPGHALPVTGC